MRKDRKIGKEILSGRQGEIDFGRPTIAIEIRNSSIRLIADLNCEGQGSPTTAIVYEACGGERARVRGTGVCE